MTYKGKYVSLRRRKMDRNKFVVEKSDTVIVITLEEVEVVVKI